MKREDTTNPKVDVKENDDKDSKNYDGEGYDCFGYDREGYRSDGINHDGYERPKDNEQKPIDDQTYKQQVGKDSQIYDNNYDYYDDWE